MTEQEKEAKTEDKKQLKEKDENIVFIGSKPFMNYVRGVEVQLSKKGNKEVVIKARGKFIARAVDVEQVAKHGPLGKDLETSSIKTNSEEFENKEGRKVNVSTIEITLVKK